jgi:hypothetical protein
LLNEVVYSPVCHLKYISGFGECPSLYQLRRFGCTSLTERDSRRISVPRFMNTQARFNATLTTLQRSPGIIRTMF